MTEPRTAGEESRRSPRDRRRAEAIVAQYIHELANVSAAPSADR